MRKMAAVMAVLMGVLVWAVGVGPADATAVPVLAHEGVENYYAGGGTLIHGCIGVGCPQGGTLAIGDVSGPALWEVWEKVYYIEDDREGPLTKYTYVVKNDSLQFGITSFHVATNRGGFDQASPTNWIGTIDPTGWHWVTLTGGGILPTGGLLPFDVTVHGHDIVSFTHVGIDRFQDGILLGFPCGQDERCTAYPNWLVSGPQVPEPGSLLLLGLGLVGVGVTARRRSR